MVLERKHDGNFVKDRDLCLEECVKESSDGKRAEYLMMKYGLNQTIDHFVMIVCIGVIMC